MIKVGIDPGHGGKNIGCHNNGITEKFYTLFFSRYLVDRISRSGEPFDVHLIRNDDVGMSLAERAEAAVRIGCQVVLCIHVNASESPSLRGLMTFHDKRDEAGYFVGTAISRAAPFHLFRGVGSAAHAITAIEPDLSDDNPAGDWLAGPRSVMRRYVDARITASLVELGFSTNQTDAIALQSPSVQSSLVSACMIGLDRFRALLEHTSPEWSQRDGL